VTDEQCGVSIVTGGSRDIGGAVADLAGYRVDQKEQEEQKEQKGARE
jgi:hypothetical protein